MSSSLEDGAGSLMTVLVYIPFHLFSLRRSMCIAAVLILSRTLMAQHCSGIYATVGAQ